MVKVKRDVLDRLSSGLLDGPSITYQRRKSKLCLSLSLKPLDTLSN